MQQLIFPYGSLELFVFLFLVYILVLVLTTDEALARRFFYLSHGLCSRCLLMPCAEQAFPLNIHANIPRL